MPDELLSHEDSVLTTASGVVVVFWYEAGVVLFAVGVGALAKPVFVPGVVTVLALGEEAAFPRLVSPALGNGFGNARWTGVS